MEGPRSGSAVLVAMHVYDAPCLIRFQYPMEYPLKPVVVRVLSNVSHPLINEDGSTALNILGHEWCPALNLRTVLISIHCMLAEPTHPAFLREECAPQPGWKLQSSLETPSEHVPTLFTLLLEAACSHVPVAPGERRGSGMPWHFLEGLRGLLRSEPRAWATSRAAWFEFLRALSADVDAWESSPPCGTLAGDGDSHDSSLEHATRMWYLEARGLLHAHFDLDGMRVLTFAKAVNKNLGELGRAASVLDVIRSFVSSASFDILFP